MKILVASITAALLAGCVSNRADLDESFGVAHRANMEAQIIDANADAGAPEGDGAAIDMAIGRYKTDTVKKPSTGGSVKQNSNTNAPQGK